MKKKYRVLMIMGICVMTMLALTGCGRKKINLNDYVAVKFTGYEEAGIAEMDPQAVKENIILDNWETFELSEEDRENGWWTNHSGAYLFADNISLSLDTASGLSNGDKVTVQWKVYEEQLAEVEKELKVKFAYSDMEITVEGLEEPQPWDAFAEMECSYDGLAPNGYIYIRSGASSAVPGLNYIPNKNAELSNGDVIEVTLAAPDGQDVMEYCRTYGKIPKELSKEIVVSGLSGYVTDAESIPAELMESMASQGEDAFRAYVAKKWDKPENLLDVSLIGNYFLKAKPGASVPTRNEIYLVYKITALNPEPEETVEYYFYVAWNDIMYLSDGTCSVDLSDYSSADANRDATFKVGTYMYYGYENLETLFNKCITTRIDSYEYSSSIQ